MKKADIGKLNCRRLSITQINAGWVIEDGKGWGEVHPTAVDALKVVRRRDATLADCGVSTVSVITWIPTSRVGRMVVNAIAKAS